MKFKDNKIIQKYNNKLYRKFIILKAKIHKMYKLQILIANKRQVKEKIGFQFYNISLLLKINTFC